MFPFLFDFPCRPLPCPNFLKFETLIQNCLITVILNVGNAWNFLNCKTELHNLRDKLVVFYQNMFAAKFIQIEAHKFQHIQNRGQSHL